MLFVHNTSRVDDEPYPTLLRDKGFTGFPSLCFMDAEGNVLVKQSQRTVDGFTATAQRLKAWTDLKAKAGKSPDAKTQRELFLVEVELGVLDAETIKRRMDELKLEGADRQLAEQKLTDLEIAALRGKVRELGPEKTSEAMAAIAKSGRKPSADMAPLFWGMVLQYAAQKQDGALGQQAYDELQQGRITEAAKKRYEQLLEQAKGGTK